MPLASWRPGAPGQRKRHPEEKAEQRTHQGPQRPGRSERQRQSGDGHSHATGHQAVEAVHEVGEVDHGGDGNHQQGKDRQEEPNAGADRKTESLNERAEAEHESGRYQLNAVTPRCGEVVTVVEQANNCQGGSEQGKGRGSEALTTEQGHPGRNRAHYYKGKSSTTRGGLAVGASGIGLIEQSTAQLRDQGAEEEPAAGSSQKNSSHQMLRPSPPERKRATSWRMPCSKAIGV